MNELLDVGILSPADDPREKIYLDDDVSQDSHMHANDAAKKRPNKKPFHEFNKMIKRKYDLDPHAYDDMPPKKRN